MGWYRGWDRRDLGLDDQCRCAREARKCAPAVPEKSESMGEPQFRAEALAPIHLEGATRSSDQPTDTQGNGGGRVRIVFNVAADRMVEGSGHLSNRIDRVLGRVHGLAIQLLDAPFGLPQLPLDPSLPIARRPPQALPHRPPTLLVRATP